MKQNKGRTLPSIYLAVVVVFVVVVVVVVVVVIVVVVSLLLLLLLLLLSFVVDVVYIKSTAGRKTLYSTH